MWPLAWMDREHHGLKAQGSGASSGCPTLVRPTRAPAFRDGPGWRARKSPCIKHRQERGKGWFRGALRKGWARALGEDPVKTQGPQEDSLGM